MFNIRFRYFAAITSIALFLFFYPYLRLLQFWGVSDFLAVISALFIYLVSLTSLMISFKLSNYWLSLISHNWLGYSFILMVLVIGFEFVHLIVKPSDNLSMVIVLLSIGITALAIINAGLIKVKPTTINSRKIKAPFNIIHLSDIHVGSRSKHFLNRIALEVNRLSAEYVVITGDLIDAGRVDFSMLEPLLKIKQPIYFVAGNHERYIDLPNVINMLEKLGIKVLTNESCELEMCQLIGIEDVDNDNHFLDTLNLIEKHASKFVLLLYHKPVMFAQVAMQGVDLMLSGHTHHGQIVPFNWLVKRRFPYISGLYSHENSHLLVSTGTGTWGPIMRIGSRSEINLITVASVS